MFIGVIALLLFIPLFKLGGGNDFSMRVSIPPLLYIAVEFIKRFTESIPVKGEFKSLDELVRKSHGFCGVCHFLYRFNDGVYGILPRDILYGYKCGNGCGLLPNRVYGGTE